jgi:AraC-like DNA-binding protein
MTALALALRGGNVALLLLLAALLFRDGRRLPATRYAVLFALSIAATMVVWAPPLALDGALWLVPLRVAAFGNSAVFWLLAAALFDDEFAPSWQHAAGWLALVALGLLGVYGSFGNRPFLAHNGLSLLLIFLALRQVLAGRAMDLVEGRRRFRVIFVVSVGLFSVTITVSATLLHGGDGYPWFGLADPLGSAVMTFVFAMMLLSLTRKGSLLSLAEGDDAAGAAAVVRPSAPIAATANGGDGEEEALLASLRALMEREKVYREEGLSIAALAQKLGLPEYRLRRLINQRLGYRNFSAFLNAHRLAEAMAALADPSQAEVPVLTIALDAGFQSIGPFNRAFKVEAGMTPTEFRRLRLGRADKSVSA